MLFGVGQDKELGERIKARREALGLSQAELGRRVGRSQQAVSQWECGEIREPRVLPGLAAALHCDLEEFLGPQPFDPILARERAMLAWLRAKPTVEQETLLAALGVPMPQPESTQTGKRRA